MATLDLTPDESLVLFEMLSRYSESDTLEVQHKAEQVVLWGMCCLLEKQLVEPFDPKYVTLLDQARARLCEGYTD
jgi:hypothetical protein